MVSEAFRSIATTRNREAEKNTPAASPAASPTNEQPGRLPPLSRTRFSARSASVARIYTGPKKLSPAQRTQVLLDILLRALQDEWPRIRNSNLGVLSGTAVVEDLVMRKIQAWVTELHTLCISHDDAAAIVGDFARRLGASQMQQLQVMLDVTDHSSLADFIRIMVYNTSNPLATEAVDSNPLSRGSQRVRKKVDPNSGNVAQLSALPTKREHRKVRVVPANQRPFNPDELRFAALLPPEHSLTLAAQSLQRLRDAALQESLDMDNNALSSENDRGGSAPGTDTRPSNSGSRVMGLFPTHVMGAYQLAGMQVGMLPPGGRPNTPPYWEADVEEWWRMTTHTRLPDETFNSIVASDPLLLYEVVPPHVAQRRKAEAAALAAAVAAAAAAAAAATAAAARGGRSNALNPNAAAGAVRRPGAGESVTSNAGGAVPPAQPQTLPASNLGT